MAANGTLPIGDGSSAQIEARIVSMLVRSRRKDEQIVVGAGEYTITICVVESHGNQVRLGITAPADVVIHRQEIWSRRESWGNDREHISTQD